VDEGCADQPQSQPHSRKRPRIPSHTDNQPPNDFVSSSGVTRFKKRRTSGGEGNDSIDRPSVSPFTPPSSRKKPRLFSPTHGWEEWPAPAHLWYNFHVNPDAATQETDNYAESDVDWLAQEEGDVDAEPDEVLDGLDIEDAYFLNSVKTATRPHVPRHLRHDPAPREPSEEHAGPGGRRSPSPSPSPSLAQAEDSRRNSAALPNTPAVDVGDFRDRLEEALSQPPSPGLSQASGESVSSSSGSDIPLKRGLRLKAGVKRRQDPEEPEDEDEEEEDEEADEPPVAIPRPVRPTRQQAKKDAKKPNQGKKKNGVVPADETEEQSGEDSIPTPNNSKPTKPIAAKEQTKPRKDSTSNAQENAEESDEDHETDEPSQGERSESEESGEEGVSEYRPARPGRNQAAKNRKKPGAASKEPPARQRKQTAKKVPEKKAPKKRLTEAERLLAEADAWKW
jgi:hypothetical protein